MVAPSNSLQITSLTIGNKTEKDLAAAGMQAIQPARDLSNVPAFQAIKNLPEGVSEEKIRADAHNLAFNSDLNQLSFLNLIRQYEVDATPAINDMLQSVQARKADEAGERVVMIVNKCDDFNKHMPKPNPKFVARVKARVATAGEILDNVRWLAREIRKAGLRFQDMLTLCDTEQAYHMEQSNLSVEACARDLQISKEEKEREDALIQVTALLEALQDELSKRLDGSEKLSDEDQTRLQNVATLVIARVKNLRPMAQKTNIAVRRFAVQANSNSLTSLDQYDFATAGIAGWKSDIAGQLDAQANINMNLAYIEGVKFTDEQAHATADAFDAQMQSFADMLQTQLTAVETINYVTQSLVRAGATMSKALESAHQQSKDAAKAITQSKADIKSAEDKLKADTARILRS